MRRVLLEPLAPLAPLASSASFASRLSKLAAFVVIMTSAFALAGCPQNPSSGPATDPPQVGEEVVLLPYPPEAGAVTWASWAGQFTEDYCVTCHNPQANCGTSNGPSCHVATDPVLFDLRDQAAFVARQSVIRCGIAKTDDPSWNCAGTGPLTFPKLATSGTNPFPTDEQREIMVSWITAGCP